MPEAARLYDQISATAQRGAPSWSGEVHGEISAMHRAIERRLLAESIALAVIPLPARPMERMLARFSRIAGWLVVAGMTFSILAALVALRG